MFIDLHLGDLIRKIYGLEFCNGVFHYCHFNRVGYEYYFNASDVFKFKFTFYGDLKIILKNGKKIIIYVPLGCDGTNLYKFFDNCLCLYFKDKEKKK